MNKHGVEFPGQQNQTLEDQKKAHERLGTQHLLEILKDKYEQVPPPNTASTADVHESHRRMGSSHVLDELTRKREEQERANEGAEEKDDSLYYLTASGLSMRIKRAAITDGDSLRVAVQPIMELILFHNLKSRRRDEFSRTPVLGWTTRDYQTADFKKRLLDTGAKTDFQSPLIILEKGGKIVGVIGPDEVWIHEGNRVNSISR